MNIIIRKAREDELKIVQDLSYQLFVFYQKDDSTLNMNWSYEKAGAEFFTDRISGKDGVCFVAETNNMVVGYLAGAMIKPLSYRHINKMSELENTLVLESYRKQGIGEKLFDEFLNWSKEQGAKELKYRLILAVPEAVMFYKNVGFVDYSTELEYKI